VGQAAENSQTRLLLRARNALAYAGVAPDARLSCCRFSTHRSVSSASLGSVPRYLLLYIHHYAALGRPVRSSRRSAVSAVLPPLPGLTGLAADELTLVTHALAQVGLRRTQLADVRRHLAYLLLVDAIDVHARTFNREADALRRVDLNRMRVAQSQHQLGA